MMSKSMNTTMSKSMNTTITFKGFKSNYFHKFLYLGRCFHDMDAVLQHNLYLVTCTEIFIDDPTVIFKTRGYGEDRRGLWQAQSQETQGFVS